LAQTASHRLAFSTGRPHHHHHHCHITPASHPISLHCRFTRRARNQATVVRFRLFSPNPLPPPRVLDWAAAPSPPSLPRCPSIPPYLPPPPFHTARPKPSHGGSISVFGPNPLRRLALSTGQPHHHHYHYYTSPPSLATSLYCHFAWRTRNRATAARFLFFGPKPTPPLASSNGSPNRHHHLISHTPPTTAIAPYSRFQGRAQNRALGGPFPILGTKPTTPLASSNGHPNHHHHLVFTPHQPPPSPPAAISSSAHETELRRVQFRF
jgi:hypothetical protein